MIQYGVRMLRAIGVVLLLINLFGLTINQRDAITQSYKSPISHREILSPDDFFAQTQRNYGENDADYGIRITHAVHKAILNYFQELHPNILRVSLFENFLLFGQSFIDKDRYKNYEFCNVRKAVERGIGLCSQQVITLGQLFIQEDIRRTYVDLQGHVVLMGEIDTKTHEMWIFDPDYDVIIPYDLRTIEEHPDLIRPFYLERGYEEKTVDNLVEIYGSKNNHTALLRENYFYKVCSYERRAYMLKWFIPLWLLLPWMLTELWKIRKKLMK